jgi:ABC-type nitrate/sulfonate/bicarbonate transport system substrate-binding protein
MTETVQQSPQAQAFNKEARVFDQIRLQCAHALAGQLPWHLLPPTQQQALLRAAHVVLMTSGLVQRLEVAAQYCEAVLRLDAANEEYKKRVPATTANLWAAIQEATRVVAEAKANYLAMKAGDVRAMAQNTSEVDK